jgi:hypothetical protein
MFVGVISANKGEGIIMIWAWGEILLKVDRIFLTIVLWHADMAENQVTPTTLQG